MGVKGIQLSGLLVAVLAAQLLVSGSAWTSNLQPSYPKAISDLKDSIVKGLGFQADGFKVSGFDMRDALVGRSVAYEFDIEIDNKVLPFKLLEDVHRWEYVDLPIFRDEHPVPGAYEEKKLSKKQKIDEGLPVLAPFQLDGPMELWIQDADNMRISLPHDVDAGVLKKVILAEGAVVTVKGARSVSLRHPVEFRLPLNRTHDGFASGILNLAEQIRQLSHSQSSPILSLRIVGPTSLTSPSVSSTSTNNNKRLKLKRLAPGLVELSSLSSSPKALFSSEDAATLLTPSHFSTMWPVSSINVSNPNLLGLEKLLATVLGPKANKEGSFKLLKADVSAQTFVKIGFRIEKKLKEGDMELQSFPAWRTKPESVRMHFEVLAKVDGMKVVPERVVQVKGPVEFEDIVVISNNITMSKVPIVNPPVSPFML